MKEHLEYKGARWFKCDLHLHTTASECFQDKSVSAEQWVDRAIEQGLDCVAVTDHNTGTNIDAIREASKDKSLTVFPGVEITCDTAKIHLLILFDVTKTSADISDFLVCAGIKRDDFGKQKAFTKKSIFDIATLANENGAIVIPAHIDEYNGLGDVSAGNLEEFFSKYSINAVQVVHHDFLNKALHDSNNTLHVPNDDELKRMLNDYYGNPNPAIDDSTVKKWFTPVKYAVDANVALLTFSDNPHEPKNSRHGLWGIGNHYTWIKMDEKPTLESLRQAFLLPNFKIKNEFESPDNPYNTPEIWIKSISISNTTITSDSTPLKLDFNPQLNTIIGGRGSGKSSVLRFIRGVFNRTIDLEGLHNIFQDHQEFYRVAAGHPQKGVFNDESVIEIEIIKSNSLHRIIASKIQDSNIQEIKIEKFDEQTLSWEIITEEGYIDSLKFEQYSQKQIYEIAQEPNALRERIDNAIEGAGKIKHECKLTESDFFKKAVSLREMDRKLAEKGKIENLIKYFGSSIQKRLQHSSIATLLTEKEEYAKEELIINRFKRDIEFKEGLLSSLIQEFETTDIDFTGFKDAHSDALKPITKTVIDSLVSILESYKKVKEDFSNSVNNSIWKTDYNKNTTDFSAEKLKLGKKEINDVEQFEELLQEKVNLEEAFAGTVLKSKKRDSELSEKVALQEKYLNQRKELAAKRKDFVTGILQDDKVKINIKGFCNKTDFEMRLRKIIQREDFSFQDDIDNLIKLCFQGNVEKTIKKVRDVFLKIRKGEDVDLLISSRFVNLVKSLNDSQIDEIELLLPEDEIEIEYKSTSKAKFKPLSTASAGQKTTAILTFILSYGRVPLILDQPEDDLDNRLVYDLIVDRLKKTKENRQLIVATHNANIPVNGDAEYIISMDMESEKLKILNEGTVEQTEIKREICDVMEGSEQAFNMRSKRYKQI